MRSDSSGTAVTVDIRAPIGSRVHGVHYAKRVMAQYAHRVPVAQVGSLSCGSSTQSQPMSQFHLNLTARRESLGLEVGDVQAELNRRGFDLAYSTVAGWFNGSRGARWKVDELRALLDILQTDLKAMAGEAELVEEPVRAAAAREMQGLSDEQQQAVLVLIRSMKSSPQAV